jgi:catechol 2,3-dioxygenase-like lactoylglutathione lyase family enzyme
VLTPAEWTVLHWVRHGLTRREIAGHLGTSEGAVRYHVRNIRAKLDVPDQITLRHWAGRPAGSALVHQEATVNTSSGIGIRGLGQVALHVRDAERATTFYRDTLGLAHLYTYGSLVFFECGGTRLYLQAVTEERWVPGSILYFDVADITRAHEELAARDVTFQGAPHLIHRHDDGTEEWMAFFEDGEGNTLALMSRVEPGA